MDIMSYLLGSNSAIKKGLKVQVVDELPTIGEENVLYLVPKQNTGTNDVFEEWIYINNSWEQIGTTDIDLSNYYTKSETIAKMSSMPTASADYVGTVVLYIGTTTSSYTNGRFYIGISTGSPATYSWSEMTVQDLTNYYTQTQVNNITGSLSDLSTTSKTNLVSAINEVASAGGGLTKITPTNGTMHNAQNIKDADRGIYEISYDSSNTTDGILIVSRKAKSGSSACQVFIQPYGAGTNYDVVNFGIRSKGSYSSYGSFTQFGISRTENRPDNQYPMPYNNTGIQYITRDCDLYKWYGYKVKSDLTTTNKDSLVDAINEVNPKGLTGYDATKTQTLKNINGTLTWVDD